MNFWSALRLTAAAIFAAIVVASCLKPDAPGTTDAPDHPAPRAAPIFHPSNPGAIR